MVCVSDNLTFIVCIRPATVPMQEKSVDIDGIQRHQEISNRGLACPVCRTPITRVLRVFYPELERFKVSQIWRNLEKLGGWHSGLNLVHKHGHEPSRSLTAECSESAQRVFQTLTLWNIVLVVFWLWPRI